jgi:virulence factor Mce-like protein
MEARTPHWRAFVLPLSFALACVVLTIATWVSFGGSLPFQPEGYRIYLPLPRATNIYQDTSVRIAGISVGKVVGVSRSGARGARALIELKPQFAPVRTGATAIVRAKTLLGEGYIEIAPGSPDAPPVPDGGTLGAGQVKPTEQLFDVLRTFTPPTRARIRSMFAGLAAATLNRSQALSDSIAYAGPTADNLATIAETLDGQGASLTHLVADTGTVLSALGRRAGVIETAVRAGNDVLAVTAQRNQALRATIVAFAPFLHELRAASTTLGAASGDIGAGVGALERATPQLVPAVTAIDRATPTFRELFLKLPPVLAAGDQELPALNRILDTGQLTLGALYGAMRQLIPVLQLISLDRTSVIGSLANSGQIQNGVMMAPGIGPTHYAAGAVTLWNESLGGWVKKLPTNRSNPYPGPNSEADIAHGGLRAFDCRNTGNEEYLPPTGTGAPPCLVQGPVAFNGQRNYYPRLQETGP